jgi:hypothetical protein
MKPFVTFTKKEIPLILSKNLCVLAAFAVRRKPELAIK